MREIKFRGYHVDAKDMVYFGLGEDHISCQSEDGEAFKFHLEDEFPVMQFTGLLDKNGVEIYEGDIVKAASEGEWRTLEVRWRQEGAPMFILYPAYRNGKFWNLHGSTDGRETCEVIGNIYESPELLEAAA